MTPSSWVVVLVCQVSWFACQSNVTVWLPVCGLSAAGLQSMFTTWSSRALSLLLATSVNAPKMSPLLSPTPLVVDADRLRDQVAERVLLDLDGVDLIDRDGVLLRRRLQP